MNSFSFKDLEIEHIVKKGMKNSYISIKDEARVILKTPEVSKEFVLKLLDDKELWIRKKLLFIKEHTPIRVKIEDEVLLFGEIYSVDELVSLRQKLQKIKINSHDKIHKCYNDFYKESALEYIVPRVKYFSKVMQLDYKEIKFRKMKSRWGSCNSNKILTFNTELMKTKKELIDYVVVHELAHLKYMNHSKKFHALVEEFLPNSQYFSKELKKIRLVSF